MTDYKP